MTFDLKDRPFGAIRLDRLQSDGTEIREAVVMFLELPAVSTEQYDKLNEAMGTTRPENESDGLLFYVCASTSDGLLICDIWRSREELDDFVASRPRPAAAPLGLPEGPPPRLGEPAHRDSTSHRRTGWRDALALLEHNLGP